jgi:hypothetical protein
LQLPSGHSRRGGAYDRSRFADRLLRRSRRQCLRTRLVRHNRRRRPQPALRRQSGEPEALIDAVGSRQRAGRWSRTAHLCRHAGNQRGWCFRFCRWKVAKSENYPSCDKPRLRVGAGTCAHFLRALRFAHALVGREVQCFQHPGRIARRRPGRAPLDACLHLIEDALGRTE